MLRNGFKMFYNYTKENFKIIFNILTLKDNFYDSRYYPYEYIFYSTNYSFIPAKIYNKIHIIAIISDLQYISFFIYCGI